MIGIMISIKPYWFAKILNGEKNIEVRKNEALAKAIQKLIDNQGYAPILGYCSKDKNLLRNHFTSVDDTLRIDYPCGYEIVKSNLVYNENYDYYDEPLNGKVPALLICREVEEITYRRGALGYYYETHLCQKDLLELSCLNFEELDNYLKGNTGYAIHISQLKIFDKPKELWQLSGIRPNRLTYMLEKAPQNYCYVEVDE